MPNNFGNIVRLDLVIFAFENGMQGDIFVQKSPACTVDVLAKALKAIYNSSSDIKYIGTRHGEKLFETLVNREEMVKAEDLTQYYRIPADHRDLNYKTFEDEGQSTLNSVLEYNSSNTDILTVETATELLLKLEEIKADLKAI